MHVVKQQYDNKIGVGNPLLLSRHVFCFLLRQLVLKTIKNKRIRQSADTLQNYIIKQHESSCSIWGTASIFEKTMLRKIDTKKLIL